MLKKCRVESNPVFCIMRQKSANDYGSKIYEGLNLFVEIMRVVQEENRRRNTIIRATQFVPSLQRQFEKFLKQRQLKKSRSCFSPLRMDSAFHRKPVRNGEAKDLYYCRKYSWAFQGGQSIGKRLDLFNLNPIKNLIKKRLNSSNFPDHVVHQVTTRWHWRTEEGGSALCTGRQSGHVSRAKSDEQLLPPGGHAHCDKRTALVAHIGGDCGSCRTCESVVVCRQNNATLHPQTVITNNKEDPSSIVTGERLEICTFGADSTNISHQEASAVCGASCIDR